MQITPMLHAAQRSPRTKPVGQRAHLGLKLDDLKKSGQEIGQEVKSGFESAAADLEKAYENSKSKFKD